MKNIKKAKFILTLITILLIFIVIFLAVLVFQKYVLKKNFEDTILNFASKNQNTIFTIDSITLFSSADAAYKTNTANNFTIENLYQYTDIALFLKNTFHHENNIRDHLVRHHA